MIISTLLIQFYGWTGFDPIASLFIAVLIAASVIPLVLDTGKILCLDVADRSVRIQDALAEVRFIFIFFILFLAIGAHITNFQAFFYSRSGVVSLGSILAEGLL